MGAAARSHQEQDGPEEHLSAGRAVQAQEPSLAASKKRATPGICPLATKTGGGVPLSEKDVSPAAVDPAVPAAAAAPGWPGAAWGGLGGRRRPEKKKKKKERGGGGGGGLGGDRAGAAGPG